MDVDIVDDDWVNDIAEEVFEENILDEILCDLPDFGGDGGDVIISVGLDITIYDPSDEV